MVAEVAGKGDGGRGRRWWRWRRRLPVVMVLAGWSGLRSPLFLAISSCAEEDEEKVGKCYRAVVITEQRETKKGVTNTPKLLYKPRDCYCGTRAEIKVVEKSEKSKGELYFICRKERAARCGFFDWCLPVEWTSSSKIGGWGSTEYTNVCATKVINDVVALEKEIMSIRQQLEYSKKLTKFLAICLVIAMGVIMFK
ncbi:hypothetical protein RHGRI_017054 [Rhododendron griersonianum]|uniref:GRF-type domain-containing protein n=1 Tax=Rhododendron griersonianum TaxID=479676 RepID=A0AAV6JWE5_9ERIC|nr:hypothetical protein RHGRI_017054 [Rhododendron griersonianum]